MSLIKTSDRKARVLSKALNKGRYSIKQIEEILRKHDVKPETDVEFGLILEKLFEISKRTRPVGLFVEFENEDNGPDHLICSFKYICVTS